ncbi:MAG: phosphatidylglycerophosphatase A [Acetobacteraceae bacterium]
MRFVRLLAAGFGTGYAPIAPGTVGSAAALVLGVAMLSVSPWLLALAALVASLGGFWAVARADIEGDPGWVVIDEFAGQWITLLGIGAVSVPWVMAAFALFRVLDVTKPGPIGWADRQHGTFGVMADDIIAGVIGAVMLAAVGLWLRGG